MTPLTLRDAQIESEQFNLNPSQQAYMLKNLPGLTNSTESLIGDTNKINKELNDELLSNPRYLKMLRDATVPEARHFRAINDLLQDRNHAVLIKKYGNDYERREGLADLADVYNDLGVFGQVRSNWNFARQNLQMGEKQADLARARENGDPQAIEEALAEVQRQQEIIDGSHPAGSMLGRGTLSMATSMADNPWAFLAGAAASTLTAGAGAPAWLATLAGGAAGAVATAPRSYELEMGGAYQEIKAMYPDIPEERAIDLARNVGYVNAALESVPMLFSGGVTGRGLAKINKPLARAAAKAGLRREVATNPKFVQELGYELKKQTMGKWTLDTLADSSVEVTQEVLQNAITSAASRVAAEEGGTLVGYAAEDLADFVANPFAPEHAEKWNTIIETALGSVVMSAGTSGIGRGVESGVNALSEKNKTIRSAAAETSKWRKFADGMFEWRQTARAPKEGEMTPRAHLMQMVANNQVPATVFIDEDAARLLAETRQDVAERLNLIEAIQNKDANGGMIEIAIEDYDEVINSDGTLYQMVKDNITFDPKALSMAAFTDRLLAGERAGGEIAAAMRDPNSVYNRVAKALSRVEQMSPAERRFNAALMQTVVNRARDAVESNQIVEDFVSQIELSLARTNLRGENIGLTDTPEQAKARRETEKELRRRIMKTDSETLATILDEKGFNTRTLTALQIKSLARMNIDKFSLDDKRLETKSRMERAYESIAHKEAVEHEGNELLLGAGLTQEQIDKLPTAVWTEMVKEEAKRQNELAGLPAQDSIIDEDALEAIEAIDDDLLFQKTEKGIVAGSFRREVNKYIIRLEKTSNPTTFAHETFHLFNTFLIEQYNAGNLTDFWKKNVESMAREFGGKIEDGKVSFDTAAMERGADAFGNYILKGKVPDTAMRPLLAAMKHIFARVYRLLGLRKVKLNKKITDVFDSIFMAQEDVEQAQRNRGLLAVAKPSGADNALYNAYQETVLVNRASASNKYVNMVDKYNEEKASPEYQNQLNERREQIMAALAEDPHYRIKARYDELVAAGEQNPMGILQSEYMPEYTAAELEQYTTMPPAEEVATQQAAQEMEEGIKNKYNLLDETLAEVSMRDRNLAKSMLMESILINGGTLADFERAWVEMNTSVENTFGVMDVSKATDREYWLERERASMERYAIYKQTGQMEKAASERRNQAIMTLMRMKVETFRKEYAKFERLAQSYRGNQETNKMSAESYDLVQSLLKAWKYPILSRRISGEPLLTKLENWFTEQESKLMTDMGRMRPLFGELAGGTDGPRSQITTDQLKQLAAVVEIIDKAGKTEWTIKTESETKALQKLFDDTAARFEEKNINKDNKLVNNIANPEPILRAILPQSVIDAIIDPLFAALSRSEIALKQWNDKMDKAKSLVNLSASEVTYAGVTLTHRDLADLLLSMGTEHAFDNFCMKLGVSREQAETIASEALRAEPKYEQFMNDVWALYDEIADPLNESYRQTFNRIFIKKEPRAFTIDGKEFKGGYVPELKNTDTMRLDPNYVSRQIGEAAFEKLVVKDADGNVNSIVDDMESYIYIAARDAYVREAYNNAQKFFGKEQFSSIAGDRIAKFARDWLDGIATPPQTDSNLVAKFANCASVGILGFGPVRLLVQLSGIIPAMALVGRRGFMAAGIKTLKAATQGRLYEEAKSRSDYMRARYDNASESLFGQTRGMMFANKAVSLYNKLGMGFISYGDAFASLTAWDAAYDQSLAAGRTEQQAIADADAVVRQTQSDSMIASRAKFMQSQWSRILSPFLSYIMSVQSIVRGKIITKDYFDAAYFAFMYIIVSTLFESMGKELNPLDRDDDDDDAYWDRVMKRWAGDATNTLGSSIYPVMGIGGAVVGGLAAGIEKAYAGQNDIFKSYQMSVPMMQYLDRIRQIINATPGLTDDEKRGEAWEKVLVPTAGLLGNEPMKLAKRYLASD